MLLLEQISGANYFFQKKRMHEEFTISTHGYFLHLFFNYWRRIIIMIKKSHYGWSKPILLFFFFLVGIPLCLKLSGKRFRKILRINLENIKKDIFHKSSIPFFDHCVAKTIQKKNKNSVMKLNLTLLMLMVFISSCFGDPCSPSTTNYVLPYPKNRLLLVDPNQSMVPQCEFIDLNGDGLPDYICSFAWSNGKTWTTMNCVYLNSGSNWILQ